MCDGKSALDVELIGTLLVERPLAVKCRRSLVPAKAGRRIFSRHYTSAGFPLPRE
jgi:hypothetical protein